MDLLTRKVTRDGADVALLPTEYRILEFTMRHAGQLITRTMLFEAVGLSLDPGTNLIDVHIGRLRKKIDTPASSRSSRPFAAPDTSCRSALTETRSAPPPADPSRRCAHHGLFRWLSVYALMFALP